MPADTKRDWTPTIIAIVLIGGFFFYNKKDNTPGPGPSPAPVVVALDKATHDALVAYAQGSAKAFDSLAADTKAKKYKTVREAAQAYNEYDTQLRDAYKKSMADAMSKPLGNADLPDNADVTFAEIAKGFRKVK